MIVETQEDRKKFQTMLDSLAEWSTEWQMLFNADKCHVIHAGKKNPEFVYDWDEGHLEATEEEKDVGVIILNFVFDIFLISSNDLCMTGVRGILKLLRWRRMLE